MNNTRSYGLFIILFVLSVSLTGWYCVNKENKGIAEVKNKEVSFPLSFDSTLVATFYAKYPKLILYKKKVVSMYQKNSYYFIWYDKFLNKIKLH